VSAKVLLFLKEPVAGEVKTRLTPVLTAEEAAALYRAMVEDQLSRLDSADAARSPALLYTPDEAGERVAAWLGREREVHPQGPGDLGARLDRAIRWGFERGAVSVLVAGTDAPGLDRTVIDAAERALEEHDLVLAPSHDGGYSLIGLRRAAPELFQGIPWSSAAVLDRTLEAAERLRLTVHLLAPLPDVDTFEDVERLLLRDLGRMSATSPRTCAELLRIRPGAIARLEPSRRDP